MWEPAPWHNFWERGNFSLNNTILQLRPFTRHLKAFYKASESTQTSMTNWVQNCMHVWIHQVKILVFDKYQTRPVRLTHLFPLVKKYIRTDKTETKWMWKLTTAFSTPARKTMYNNSNETQKWMKIFRDLPVLSCLWKPNNQLKTISNNKNNNNNNNNI